MNISGHRPGLADIQALQKVDLGERVKPADHSRDDHDLPQLMHLQGRADQLRREYSQDDGALRPAAPSRMALEVGAHLGNQQRYDQGVGLDKIGPVSFTQRRSAVLRGIPGAEAIAAQYGQTFAVDLEGEAFYPRLRIANEDDARYHREEPWAGLQKGLQALYRRAHGPLPRDYDVAFVNSGHAINYLNTLVSLTRGAANAPSPRALGRGVIAFPFPQQDSENIEELLGLLGARPSSYQAKRVLCGDTPAIPGARNVDNRQLIAPLMAPGAASPSRQLRLASPEEGTGALAHTAADLLDDLCTTLVKGGQLEQHRNNPLLALGLIGLRERVDNLNALHNDTARFGNAYRAMMEEMHVVLAATSPYNAGHFKQAALVQLARRLDPAQAARLKRPEVHMATSGMNAILQGLEVAEQFSGDKSYIPLATRRHGETPLYYEAEKLLEHRGQSRTSSSRTLLATLNNSFPEAAHRSEEPWDVSAVIDATRRQVSAYKPDEKPFTLVLDATVERESDMRRLTGALSDELASGKLQLVVCKSYQKYSNLCSSKVMAGCITLLGADSPKRQAVDSYLRKVESNYDWMSNDEAQLMTHFVRSGHHEFRLLERSVANAAFVRDTCFTGEGEHAAFDGYHPHMPFAMVSMHTDADDFVWPKLSIRSAKGGMTDRDFIPADNLDSQWLRTRDSFGFSETVQAHMPDLEGYDSHVTRLSFGQESKAELTEMFYMPSRLMLAEGSEFSPLDARAHVNELVQVALTPEQRRDTADKPLAYKLAVVGANQAARLDDQQRLAGGVAGMRRTLEAQKGQQAFTLNKVASVVGHLGHLSRGQELTSLLADGPDREVADQLLDGLISSHMPGVSRMGRESVARFHAELCEVDMHSDDPKRRQRGVQRLVDGLSQMKVASTRGSYVGLVPDAVFKEQPVELQQRLLDLLFRPLSTPARLALIDRHLNQRQLGFAESCIGIAEHEDAGHAPGMPGLLEKRRAVLLQARVQQQG